MRTILLVISLSLSLNLFASEFTSHEILLNKIITNCKSSSPTLVLFMTQSESTKNANMEDNELYADWSYYLNNNALSISNNLAVLKSPVEIGRSLLNSQTKPKDSYSLLFIPCNKKPLYAESPIIEPYVYTYMKFYLDNKEHGITFNELLGSNDAKREVIQSPNRLGLQIISFNIQ